MACMVSGALCLEGHFCQYWYLLVEIRCSRPRHDSKWRSRFRHWGGEKDPLLSKASGLVGLWHGVAVQNNAIVKEGLDSISKRKLRVLPKLRSTFTDRPIAGLIWLHFLSSQVHNFSLHRFKAVAGSRTNPTVGPWLILQCPIEARRPGYIYRSTSSLRFLWKPLKEPVVVKKDTKICVRPRENLSDQEDSSHGILQAPLQRRTSRPRDALGCDRWDWVIQRWNYPCRSFICAMRTGGEDLSLVTRFLKDWVSRKSRTWHFWVYRSV